MRAAAGTKLAVIGGGPAGAAAAITASLEGAAVELFEKSKFPRHKVCGEFVSPEVLPLLDQLGAAKPFLAALPARISRVSMHFGARDKTARLPEVAYGLSRHAFDHLLFRRALACGVSHVQAPAQDCEPPVIVAHGRKHASTAKGRRVFGFKAHFQGPVSDAIELHFFNGGYVGINAVEDGVTNVCGLADESSLQTIRFEYDALIAAVPSLRSRLQPVTRSMEWLTTGPLVYGNQFDEPAREGVYAAGDALSFVDPFTGSGMYCAVVSGMIAGHSAARGVPASDHIRACREALGRPFAFAGVFRAAIRSGWAEYLAPWIPAAWLYRLTRPRYSYLSISS
jgi:menaquinone-9 beta-reductase